MPAPGTKEIFDTFEVETVQELFKFLEQYPVHKREKMGFDSTDWITITHVDETLSDGSTVANLDIRM